MISAAGVKTFFKKNATPIVVAVVALTVIMLAWRFMNRENFAAPLPNIVSQIQTQYANEHARFKAALMLLKPVTADQKSFVALAKTAMSGALKIAIYDPKDDRAQGPTVVAGAITYPWINSKGTAVVAKDDIEDNVAWAIAHFAGSAGDLKLSPKRLAAYQYLTAQIPRAPAAKPTIATPSPTAAATAATTAAATKSTATAVAAGAAAAAAAVKAAAAKKLADFEAAKKLVRPEDTVVGKVAEKVSPTGAGKQYSYTIKFTPSGKKLETNLVFQTTNANFGAAPKITLDRDGDVLMINGAPYGKWNPLG
jgi:hypothetical protein